MKITLDRSEYKALNNLRGLPPDAHMLVMCGDATATGGMLDGSRDAFTELVEFISEELADGMISARDARALVALCQKIDPHCVDWSPAGSAPGDDSGRTPDPRP